MDQVTQTLLGAAAAQVVCGRRLGRAAAVVGGAAGLAPDVDMAFLGLGDPLFPLEVHRTATHALVAVPVGALLVTGLALLVPRLRTRPGTVYAAALVGWLTHGPLDACTSYGTQLLWPFDRRWVAWDVAAVVDPVFTLVLLVGVVRTWRRGRARPAALALVLAGLWLGFGLVQRGRALDVQSALADARGDRVEHGRVLPMLGGPWLWRSLYVSDGRIHADGIRLVPGAGVAVRVAGARPRFGPEDLPEGIPDPVRVRTAVARLAGLADGFLARLPGSEDPTVVGDVRFGAGWGFDAVWGLRLVPGEPAAWVVRTGLGGGRLRDLAVTVLGVDGGFRPLPAVLEAERGVR